MSDTRKYPDFDLPEGASEGSILEQFNLLWPTLPVVVCVGTPETDYVRYESTLGETPYDNPEMREAFEELYVATMGMMQFASAMAIHEGHEANDCDDCHSAKPIEDVDDATRANILGALLGEDATV